jgi:hypothetical protein
MWAIAVFRIHSVLQIVKRSTVQIGHSAAQSIDPPHL